MEKIKNIIVNVKEEVLLGFFVIFCFTFIMNQSGVPSNSMEETIGTGDRIIINHVPYYYRQPKRGEIVVFNGPDGKEWVKRVIGLPGETVDIRDGNVYIDGVQLEEEHYLVDQGQSEPSPLYENVGFPYVIPEKSYFLMGDNRFASEDSRYMGAISETAITGKAMMRIYPFNKIGFIH